VLAEFNRDVVQRLKARRKRQIVDVNLDRMIVNDPEPPPGVGAGTGADVSDDEVMVGAIATSPKGST
jgi:hypothetical protein